MKTILGLVPGLAANVSEIVLGRGVVSLSFSGGGVYPELTTITATPEEFSAKVSALVDTMSKAERGVDEQVFVVSHGVRESNGAYSADVGVVLLSKFGA